MSAHEGDENLDLSETEALIERNEPSVPCHFCKKSLYHVSHIYVTDEGCVYTCKECAAAQDAKYRKKHYDSYYSKLYPSEPSKKYVTFKPPKDKIQKRKKLINGIFNKIKDLAARVKWI